MSDSNWITNANPLLMTAPSSTIASVHDMLALIKKLPPPEPIFAFAGTAEQFRAALQANGVEQIWARTDPFSLPRTIHGLDVIEEDGWCYVGTAKQLAEAKKTYGSLTAARQFGEAVEEAKKRRTGP